MAEFHKCVETFSTQYELKFCVKKGRIKCAFLYSKAPSASNLEYLEASVQDKHLELQIWKDTWIPSGCYLDVL